MKEKKLPHLNDNDQSVLQLSIEALQKELDLIEQETLAFENILRARLTNEIVELQELTVLYKKQKKAKKEKRLEQKRRGKNYREPIGLKLLPNNKTKVSKPEEAKEKKRLYREAMLHVHPDKFSMNEDKLDLATDVTLRLIDIYRTGSLQDLQLYHAHIFSGNALQQSIEDSETFQKNQTQDLYLEKEKERLEELLIIAKSRRTYIVLKEYSDPLLFVEELQLYYAERITKFRKRTRKTKISPE